MADQITRSAAGLDLTDRVFQSSAVAASPSASTITTICSTTWSPVDFPAMLLGVELEGYCSVTIGTNGVLATLQIRRTNTTGTVIATTGAVTVVATQVYNLSCQGLDTTATTPGQVYVLCLTIGSGSASSTVGSAQLFGTVY